MLRRSRISVRPNVQANPNAAGRSGPQAHVSQDAPGPLPVSQEVPQVNQDAWCGVNKDYSVAVGTERSPVSPLKKSTVPGDTSDAGGETSSSAAHQRRKRFSIKPTVAPALNRVRSPQSPPVRTVVLEGPSADSQDVTTSSQTTDAAQSQGTASPSQHPMLSVGTSGGDACWLTTTLVPAEDDSSAERAQVVLEKSQPTKDVPPKPSDLQPCLSDKEAVEISERAKTLVSKSGLPPSRFTLSRLLNDSSDLQRLEKDRKLRQLVKKEMSNYKAKKKKMKNVLTKAQVKITPDPAKMTMRDLIYYVPVSNPMRSPERAPTPPLSSQQVGRDDDRDDQQEEDNEEDEEQLMVPRVKVAEDGSLILDEESLTVDVKRPKGLNPADGKDPVFERGSTTTYSSFRKPNYSKPWSTEETDMFFLAISMVGTDFSMICQLFPHRTRTQIKHKFSREKRFNSWRVDKAFKETRKLNIEYFKLLGKVLEVQKCQKPKPSRGQETKSPSEEKTTRKSSKKTKGRTAEMTLSKVEEEEEEKDGWTDMEEAEGEKEYVSNERGAPASPRRKRKRENKDDDESIENPDENIKTSPRQWLRKLSVNLGTRVCPGFSSQGGMYRGPP